MVLFLVAENVGQLLFEGGIGVHGHVGVVFLTLVLLLVVVGVYRAGLADILGHVEVGLSSGAWDTIGSIEIWSVFLAVCDVLVEFFLVVIVSQDFFFRNSIEDQVGGGSWVGNVL